MKRKPKKKMTSPQPPHGSAADFEALLRSSMDELLLKTNAHRESWGLGEEEQWYLDEGAGELIFTFKDAVTSVPAQIIGTLDIASHTWTWGWADPLLADHLKNDSWQVRDYGAHHGFQHLLTASWEAEESHCWYMTALACQLCHTQGAFRGISGEKQFFLTFGDATTVSIDEPAPEIGFEPLMAETAEQFKGCVDNLEDQRRVCVQYLSQGALAGFAQDELIHRLGLSAPSVLDLAGYTADQAEIVMALLKGITDEEIASATT